MERVNVDEIEFGNDYTYRLKGQPFTGIAFEIDENGTLVSEIEFCDGMQNGKSCEWSSDGRLICEEFFFNNTRHGLRREWSDSGALVREKEIEHGICTRCTTWNDDGTIASKYELDENDQQFKLLELIRAGINQQL